MGRQSFIVAAIAIATSAVLLLTGALDDKQASVNLDPSAAASTTTPSASAAPNRAMIDYLTALKNWTGCIGGTPPQDTTGSTASPCGDLPIQPDDPQLTAYLVSVLDWNKCAAPRLRHGGLVYAVDACGPQPVSPLDG